MLVPFYVDSTSTNSTAAYTKWWHFRVHYSLTLLLHPTAAFSVSLELQGHCSDKLTLICSHSDAITPPQWIHNGTLESGSTLVTAFPGAVYNILTRTEHTTTITGIDNVRALDGYLIQCAYNVLGNVTKSNAVQYSFIPPGQSWSTRLRTYVLVTLLMSLRTSIICFFL